MTRTEHHMGRLVQVKENAKKRMEANEECVLRVSEIRTTRKITDCIERAIAQLPSKVRWDLGQWWTEKGKRCRKDTAARFSGEERRRWCEEWGSDCEEEEVGEAVRLAVVEERQSARDLPTIAAKASPIPTEIAPLSWRVRKRLSLQAEGSVQKEWGLFEFHGGGKDNKDGLLVEKE